MMHDFERGIPERELGTAFSRLHAADDVYDRVMERAAGAPQARRRGSAMPFAAAVVLGAAVALAMAGTAYAVISSGFAERVWGDHGLGETVTWDSGITAGDGPATWTQRFGGAAPEDLPSEVTDAVQAVECSVEGNGYTLSIHELLVDENGAGAVTFTLSNPDGVVLRTVEETGQLAFDVADERSIDLIRMNLGEPDPGTPQLDTRTVFDRDAMTETSVEGVLYFTSFGTYEDLVNEGVSWSLCWHRGDALSGTADTPADIQNGEATTSVVVPQRAIPVRTATDGSGNTAWFGPMSIRVRVAGADEGANEFIGDYLAVTMADGSERVIWDAAAGTIGHYHVYGTEGGSVTYVLTEYLPVGEEQSITVRGRIGGERGVSLALPVSS